MAVSALMSLKTSGELLPSTYTIYPEFLFRVTSVEVLELVGRYISSIPAYSLITDGPWADSYFAKKRYSTGKITINAVTLPTGAFTLEMWLRFASDTIAGDLAYAEYINSLQELRMNNGTNTITVNVGGSTGRVTASHPTSLATLQECAKLHLALVVSGAAGSSGKLFVNGVPGTTGTRGNYLGNTGYLDLLRVVMCEFAEVVFREGDATAIVGDPLYIAPGETTFTPPTGPYVIGE